MDWIAFIVSCSFRAMEFICVDIYPKSCF